MLWSCFFMNVGISAGFNNVFQIINCTLVIPKRNHFIWKKYIAQRMNDENENKNVEFQVLYVYFNTHQRLFLHVGHKCVF